MNACIDTINIDAVRAAYPERRGIYRVYSPSVESLMMMQAAVEDGFDARFMNTTGRSAGPTISRYFASLQS